MTPLEALTLLAELKKDAGGRERGRAASAVAGWPAVRLPLLAAVCSRPTANPNVIVVGMTSGPNNLDPRIGTDEVVAEDPRS